MTDLEFHEQIYQMKLRLLSMRAYAKAQVDACNDLVCRLEEIQKRSSNEKELTKYIERCRNLMQYQPNESQKN